MMTTLEDLLDKMGAVGIGGKPNGRSIHEVTVESQLQHKLPALRSFLGTFEPKARRCSVQ